jgi:hypothetical protein
MEKTPNDSHQRRQKWAWPRCELKSAGTVKGTVKEAALLDQLDDRSETARPKPYWDVERRVGDSRQGTKRL